MLSGTDSSGTIVAWGSFLIAEQVGVSGVLSEAWFTSNYRT